MAKQELVSSRVNELKVHRKQEHKNSGKEPLVAVPPENKLVVDSLGWLAVHRKRRNDKDTKRGPNKRTLQKMELVEA